MIKETSINYSGRKTDLCLFPRLLLPDTPVNMELSTIPMSITGASKAAQGFIRYLFTSIGEIAGSPEMGTNFSSKMSNRSSIRYPSDVSQIFSNEAAKAIDQWNGDSVSRPTDEQIKSVSLADLEITSSGISISLELTTRSASAITFFLPVNWSN